MAVFAAPEAVAQITTPRVTIICGSACQARRQVDQMEQWADLESYMRGLYASRRSWNEFTDDPSIFYVGWSWDLRCNTSARAVAGGTTASSAASQQKSAAEAVFSTLRTAMGGLWGELPFEHEDRQHRVAGWHRVELLRHAGRERLGHRATRQHDSETGRRDDRLPVLIR
jgi:hypothetical protein